MDGGREEGIVERESERREEGEGEGTLLPFLCCTHPWQKEGRERKREKGGKGEGRCTAYCHCCAHSSSYALNPYTKKAGCQKEAYQSHRGKERKQDTHTDTAPYDEYDSSQSSKL